MAVMEPLAIPVALVPAFDAVPGLVHGFGQRVGPDIEKREATRTRMARSLSPAGRLYLLKQVHGRAVQRAPWAGVPEGDAALAAAPGDILGIETADCLPLLLVDPRRRVVAAAHAGWRGTAAGVSGAAVAELVADGSRPGDLLAALGPSIGPCCYEVGEELRAEFPGGDKFFTRASNGRSHLDVRQANATQLEAAGVDPKHLHTVDHCTRCRADLYYSYRREGAQGGRMVSFIGFHGTSP